MKKTLLFATAFGVFVFADGLVLRSDAKAESFHVGLSAFYNWLVIGRDQDPGAFGRGEVDPRGHDFNQRGRLIIDGYSILDDGVTVGFQSQHEIQLDFETERAYVYLSNDFGMLQFGNNQSAAYQLHTFVGGAGWGIDDTAHTNDIVAPAATSWNTILTPPYGPGVFTPRINYFTPRINGFQGGFSYAPDSLRGRDAQRFVTDRAQEITGGVQKNLVSAALNFARSFDDVSLSASVGGEFAFDVGDGQVPGAVDEEFSVVSTGLAVGWQAWEASVAYAYRNMSAFGQFNDGNRQDLGGSLTYSRGSWRVGPSFGYVRDTSAQNQAFDNRFSPVRFDGTPADTLGRETLRIVEFGANYALTPGVNFRGSALYVNWSSDERTRDGDGIGLGAGMVLFF